jgi:hypothetical protein
MKTFKKNLPENKFKFATTLVVFAALISTFFSTAWAAWETIVDGSSFTSKVTFANYWSYNYPWGSDHNGSARMNATNVSVAGGIVTLSSHLTNGYEGYSSLPPYLEIRYNSGTFYLNQAITVSTQYPIWDISGQFMVPTQTGTWPAFWMTGVNSWPPESDFMEFKGSDGCNQNTYDGAWQSTITPINSAGTVWHTYRMVATLENSTNVDFHYYIDGVMESEQTATTFVNSPCWLIIDYQMEGSSGSPGPGNTTYFYIKNLLVKRENLAGVLGGVVANGVHQAVVTSTGYALDVLSQNTATNSLIDQYPYNAGLNQQWLLTCLASNQFNLIGRQSGRALSVTNALLANGAKVVLEDYNETGNQIWQLNPAGNGRFQLVNANSGKTLEVSGNSSVAGALIDQWSAASSLPTRLTGIAVANTNLLLTGSPGVPGVGYSLLATTSLDSDMTNWSVILTTMADSSGGISVTSPISTTTPQAFFRLGLPAGVASNQLWSFPQP